MDRIVFNVFKDSDRKLYEGEIQRKEPAKKESYV